MILFHDMHKWFSRLQFSCAGRRPLEEGKAEHVLPSQEMIRYRLLWGADAKGGEQLRMARTMLDGEPIGMHIKSSKAPDHTIIEAVKEFLLMAHSAGIGYQDYCRFFLELLEFYMAYSSSYAAALPYIPWDQRHSASPGLEKSVPAGKIEKAFDHDEAGRLTLVSPDPAFPAAHFQMAENQEKKLFMLAELFEKHKDKTAMEQWITSIINPAPQVKTPVLLSFLGHKTSAPQRTVYRCRTPVPLLNFSH